MLITCRKGISKSSQEQQDCICGLIWLARRAGVFQEIQQSPLGSFQPGAGVHLPLLEVQVCQGAQAAAPSRGSSHMYCTKVPAALIALA